MPSLGTDAPFSYYVVPAPERESRCDLGSDDCAIDDFGTGHSSLVSVAARPC